MSNWPFLNKNRVMEASRTVPEKYITQNSDGFMGMFRFSMDGRLVRCIASDGEGWQHVSVSLEYERKNPTWELMCKIKDLFWEPEDCVVQFHPPKSVYVNWHPYCLHLWRCTLEGIAFPVPDSILIGPKARKMTIQP